MLTSFTSLVLLGASLVSAQNPSIIEALEGDAAFSTLLSLVNSSPAVVELLTSTTGYTVFAPTNAAFTDLNATRPELFTAVTTSAELLTTVLSYHVLPDLVFLPADFAGKNFVATAATLKIGANVADDAVTISSGLLQSSTVTSSVEIATGIVHVVDKVLIPPQSIADTAAEASLTELTKSLVAQDLVATLEGLADITIFAPSNEAFATLTAFAAENNLVLSDAVVSAVLALHVGQGVAFSSDIITAAAAVDVVTALGGLKISASVDDGKVKITAPGNFATVNVADVLVANGVVHVVDTVMLPDLSTLGTEKTTPSFTASVDPSPTSGASQIAVGVVAFMAVMLL